MVALSELDKSRCRRHLGFGAYAGIPAGDVARLEEAMNTVLDDYQANYIKLLLNRCDAAFDKTELGEGDDFTQKELYVGDLNRSRTQTNPMEARRVWWQNYLAETDKLAHELWVPNYWQEINLRYRFARDGGSFIKVIPGVADTSVGTRIYMALNYG